MANKKVFTDESLATFVDEIKSYTDDAVSTKANSSHTHDDRYYTESEIDTKLSGKADSSHSHSNATTSAAGFMSSSDKTNLNTVVTHVSNTENPHGVTKSQVGLGNVTNNKQMPIAGGTFTGNAIAYNTNRTGYNLRNICVKNSSNTEVSTSRFVFQRK